MNDQEITPELLAQYDISAPRYTSYPPIPYWPEIQGGIVRGWLGSPAAGKEETLSLYMHRPFCEARCT